MMPSLRSVAPPECLFYVNWAGTAAPNPGSSSENGKTARRTGGARVPQGSEQGLRRLSAQSGGRGEETGAAAGGRGEETVASPQSTARILSRPCPVWESAGHGRTQRGEDCPRRAGGDDTSGIASARLGPLRTIHHRNLPPASGQRPLCSRHPALPLRIAAKRRSVHRAVARDAASVQLGSLRVTQPNDGPGAFGRSFALSAVVSLDRTEETDSRHFGEGLLRLDYTRC